MIAGGIRSQVDKVWDAFWSGGIANPITVIEQITYLLFVKRLDELHTAKEKQANLLKAKIEKPIFKKKEAHLRWSRFKDYEAEELYENFRDEVFPFIKNMHSDDDSAFAKAMKDAVFVIPKPSLLSAVVDMISDIPMDDRDTKGDLYEYMLGKIATAGQNGQFRTPRHIIKMMVELMKPTPKDIIADPSCGTCGFLVAAGEYLREHHPKMLHNKKQLQHFQKGMFHGDDFDSTMLRIGAMNMMLHGIESPNLTGEDSLSEDDSSVRDRYTLILANPPFKGSLNYDETAKDLLQMCKTKKTELLFLALILGQLKTGGRCAVIVPDGVLFGSSKAHRQIREQLVDGHKLEAVIDMPSGVFKPYAGVSTAILVFTKTNSGGTDHVWFYHMEADGLSLDDKRDPVEQNDIPDVLEQWKLSRSIDAATLAADNESVSGKALAAGSPKPSKNGRSKKSKTQPFTDRKAKAFFVPVSEIREHKYDLSINRYKEIEYEEVEYDPPLVILDELEALEKEIAGDLKELRRMVS